VNIYFTQIYRGHVILIVLLSSLLHFNGKISCLRREGGVLYDYVNNFSHIHVSCMDMIVVSDLCMADIDYCRPTWIAFL